MCCVELETKRGQRIRGTHVSSYILVERVQGGIFNSTQNPLQHILFIK